jgi:hypothetical protein
MYRLEKLAQHNALLSLLNVLSPTVAISKATFVNVSGIKSVDYYECSLRLHFREENQSLSK